MFFLTNKIPKYIITYLVIMLVLLSMIFIWRLICPNDVKFMGVIWSDLQYKTPLRFENQFFIIIIAILKSENLISFDDE